MKKSSWAAAALALGILSYVQLFGIEKALAAGIFGLLALNEMKKDATVAGRKKAIAGLILGGLYILIVGVLFFVKGGEIVSHLGQLK